MSFSHQNRTLKFRIMTNLLNFMAVLEITGHAEMLPHVVLIFQPKNKVLSWVHYLMQVSKHKQENISRQELKTIASNFFVVVG